MRIAASRSMFQQEADVRVLVAKMNRREQLLKRLDKAWRVFRESYAGLSDAEVLEQGVTGLWSVRDIIAHVTTWEEEALKHLPLILKGGKPPRYSVTYGGINSFNALHCCPN